MQSELEDDLQTKWPVFPSTLRETSWLRLDMTATTHGALGQEKDISGGSWQNLVNISYRLLDEVCVDRSCPEVGH